MRYKIMSSLGIAAAILMTLIEGALVIYNMGCSSIIHGNHYYERMPFNWNSIQSLDWFFGAVAMLWYLLLIIPWIQYFNGMRKKNCFIPTLTGGESIGSVGFTVFNIAMIIGSAVWFIHTGEADEMGHYADFDSWWRDLLMIFMFCLSWFYVPFSIIVMVRKNKWDRDIVRPEHWWYWVVAAIPFLLLAFFVFDAWL